MATHTITNSGPRNVEIIKIMRKKYNDDGAAAAAAQTPPGTFTPVTIDQFVQITFERVRNSWKRHYRDELDAALAPTEAAALAAAQAALETAAGGVDGN